MEWLQRDKPDDLRQVREYSRLTSEVLPALFGRLREQVAAVKHSDSPVSFAVQIGDLVEGLCGNEELATRQNREALEFISTLGVPFLFSKGNHDVTGPGAPEAFKTVFHPFLSEQSAAVNNALSPAASEPAARPDSPAQPLRGPGRLASARYTIQHGQALFCFFDAYDKESLAWLEAALAQRTQRHCFVVVHPPVVPYGARSTWHLFSNDPVKRERLLGLLGKHNAFVLSGHIHKYNLLVRSTPAGGRFLQLGISSVISKPEPQPRNILSGVDAYTPDQVAVEPGFSPGTEQQRREVYVSERNFVQQFQYADLPGYAVLEVSGAKIIARFYAGVTPQLWRAVDLTELLSA